MASQLVPIPEPWCKDVRSILAQGTLGREIGCTRRVQMDWEADSLGAFLVDVLDPIMAALSKPGVRGKLISGQPEPGETYAFGMCYDNRRFYAKICLHPGRVTLLLLSAHLPNTNDEF